MTFVSELRDLCQKHKVKLVPGIELTLGRDGGSRGVLTAYKLDSSGRVARDDKGNPIRQEIRAVFPEPDGAPSEPAEKRPEFGRKL